MDIVEREQHNCSYALIGKSVQVQKGAYCLFYIVQKT
jgi:hypothetical protein